MSDYPASGTNGFASFCNNPFGLPIAFAYFYTFITDFREALSVTAI
jgi:hypothetical protein